MSETYTGFRLDKSIVHFSVRYEEDDSFDPSVLHYKNDLPFQIFEAVLVLLRTILWQSYNAAKVHFIPWLGYQWHKNYHRAIIVKRKYVLYV